MFIAITYLLSANVVISAVISRRSLRPPCVHYNISFPKPANAFFHQFLLLIRRSVQNKNRRLMWVICLSICLSETYQLLYPGRIFLIFDRVFFSKNRRAIPIFTHTETQTSLVLSGLFHVTHELLKRILLKMICGNVTKNCRAILILSQIDS
jgi:hypothetical protein